MSKYNALWKYIESLSEESTQLTFAKIEEIAGIPIDHSFLNYKKELLEYGWQVDKISLKKETVQFTRTEALADTKILAKLMAEKK